MSRKQVAAFSVWTKRRVRERCKNRCEVCGIPTENGQFHHRKPRRMGGTSDAELGLPSNCLYLHYKCHNRIESRRSMAYLLGHLVAATDNPSDSSVRLWDGWWLLDDEGGMSVHQPSDDLAETVRREAAVSAQVGNVG